VTIFDSVKKNIGENNSEWGEPPTQSDSDAPAADPPAADPPMPGS
jgi:hypothetical protein